MFNFFFPWSESFRVVQCTRFSALGSVAKGTSLFSLTTLVNKLLEGEETELTWFPGDESSSFAYVISDIVEQIALPRGAKQRVDIKCSSSRGFEADCICAEAEEIICCLETLPGWSCTEFVGETAAEIHIRNCTVFVNDDNTPESSSIVLCTPTICAKGAQKPYTLLSYTGKNGREEAMKIEEHFVEEPSSSGSD